MNPLAGLLSRVAALIVVAAAALTCGFVLGLQFERNRNEAEAGRQAVAASTLAQRQRAASTPIEARYVQSLEAPTASPPEVRIRLVRAACPAPRVQQPADSAVPVPAGDSGQSADAAGPAGASDAPAAGSPAIDAIAADVRPCVLNADQLDGLRALVRANTAGGDAR